LWLKARLFVALYSRARSVLQRSTSGEREFLRIGCDYLLTTLESKVVRLSCHWSEVVRKREDPKTETIDLRFMICEKPAVSMSMILASRSDTASHPADSIQYLLVDIKNRRDAFDGNGRISVEWFFAA
jgi:hypothetical protein